jgi:hypothetical protein
MRTWIRQRFSDVLFWCSVVASVSAIACGYSTIRASQVRVEGQCTAVEQRLDKLEARLEKLVDLHVHDQQGAAIR